MNVTDDRQTDRPRYGEMCTVAIGEIAGARAVSLNNNNHYRNHNDNTE